MAASTTTITDVVSGAPQRSDASPPFDLEALKGNAVKAAFFDWLLSYPAREVLTGLARAFWPVSRVPFAGWMVFRDEHVRELLAHDREFPVPWAQRMVELTGCRNFVLGMQGGPEYRRNYEQLARAFRRTDATMYVAPVARRVSEEILSGKSRFDAVRDLMWAVPAHLCEEYIGIETSDKLLLAEWSVAMSSYIFEPNERPPALTRELAMTAASAFRDLIRNAIRETRAGRPKGVVLPRLIDMQRSDPYLTDEVIEAHLFGMVTGLVPTNLMAGGNILDTLLRRDGFMQHTREAVDANDDDLLWRCLREALRFRHINPGAQRICESGYTFTLSARRTRYVPPGTRIVASTQSAMFDRRRMQHPHQFDPNRPADDFLIFGHGQHWCLGAHIAVAQLTQTFRALLRKGEFRRAGGRAGKLGRIGFYPAHLTIEFPS